MAAGGLGEAAGSTHSLDISDNGTKFFIQVNDKRSTGMKRFPLLICLIVLLLLVPGGVLALDTPAPHITGFSPNNAPNTVNVPVLITIYGSDFQPGITASFFPCGGSSNSVPVTYVSSSQVLLSYNFYGAKVSNWHLRLTNPTDGDVTESEIFYVTGTTSTTTTSSTSTITATATTTATTVTITPQGKNSIFFDTNPTGATIYLDGEEVGTSAFKYYTDKDGSFNVIAKKTGYEDYEDKVTVVDGGPTAHFYGLLTPLSSTETATPTGVTASRTATPVSNVTTIRKSTLKIPTPLGTDPPLTSEESPLDPAMALWAAGVGIMFAVIRRR
jgi:PEGA domain